MLDPAEAAGVTRAGPGPRRPLTHQPRKRCSSGTCKSRSDAGQRLRVRPRRSRSGADVSHSSCRSSCYRLATNLTDGNSVADHICGSCRTCGAVLRVVRASFCGTLPAAHRLPDVDRGPSAATAVIVVAVERRAGWRSRRFRTSARLLSHWLDAGRRTGVAVSGQQQSTTANRPPGAPEAPGEHDSVDSRRTCSRIRCSIDELSATAGLPRGGCRGPLQSTESTCAPPNRR